jgi:hypothetical protein
VLPDLQQQCGSGFFPLIWLVCAERRPLAGGCLVLYIELASCLHYMPTCLHCQQLTNYLGTSGPALKHPGLKLCAADTGEILIER